jgi:hypothetical protein
MRVSTSKGDDLKIISFYFSSSHQDRDKLNFVCIPAHSQREAVTVLSGERRKTSDRKNPLT